MRLFSFLIAAFGLSVFSFSLQAKSAEVDVVIANTDGASATVYDAERKVRTFNLEYGATFSVIEKVRSVYVLKKSDLSDDQTYFVAKRDLAQCKFADHSTKRIQNCLASAGLYKDRVDGVSGPKTRAAVDTFFERAGLKAEDYSRECQAQIICTSRSNRSLEAGWSANENAEAKRKIAEDTVLASLPAELRGSRRKAKQFSADLKCDKLDQLPAVAREGISLENCRTELAHKKIVDGYFNALLGLRCDKAESLGTTLDRPAEELKQCRSKAAKKEAVKRRVAALSAGNCEEVARLDKELEGQPKEAKCQWVRLKDDSTEAELLQAIDDRFNKAGADASKEAEELLKAFAARFPDSKDAAGVSAKLKTLSAKRDYQERLTKTRELYAKLAKTNRNTSRLPRLTNASRNKRLQHALSLIGFELAAIDGKIGPKTREALRQFQSSYGFRRTSSVTRDQMDLLEALTTRMDLAHTLYNQPQSAFAGDVGTPHETLIPSCRLSHKSSFGSSADSYSECGYVTAKGEWAIPPVFASTDAFKKGRASVSAKWNGQYLSWLIDQSGVFINPKGFRWLSRSRFSSAWIACEKDRRCGVLSETGQNWLIEPKFESVRDVNGHWFVGKQKEAFVMVSIDGARIEENFIGQNVISVGTQFVTDKDYEITIFKPGGKSFKSKYRGYPLQDCASRLIINDPDGKNSYIYKADEKAYLKISGSFQRPPEVAQTCRDKVVIQRPKSGHGILDLKTNSVGKLFYSISSDSNKPNNAYLIASEGENYDTLKEGIIDWDGNWLVAPTYKRLYVGEDGYFSGIENNSVVTFRLVKSEGGNWKIQNKRHHWGEVAYPVKGHPGYASVSYGNTYSFAGGKYLVTPTGDLIPKTAEADLTRFNGACEAVIGNNTGSAADGLRKTCSDYLATRGTSNPLNKAASSEAMLTKGYERLDRGYLDEAKEWFFKAAHAGSPTAQNFLGELYAEGVPEAKIYQSNEQAARWFMRAATNGYQYAQHNVAVMFLNGQYFAKDYSRAYYWTRLAAAQGLPDAIHNKRALETYFAGLSAQKRQRAKSMTLNDVWSVFSRYAPSRAELDAERRQRQAANQCRSNLRSCYASCEGQSRKNDREILALGVSSPYSRCRLECSRINC